MLLPDGIFLAPPSSKREDFIPANCNRKRNAGLLGPPTQAPQSPFVSGRPASPCIASSDKGLTTSQPYLPLLKFLCLSRVILHFFHTCTIHTRIHRLIQKTDKIYILLCKTFFHVARGSFIMTFSLAAQ